VHTGLSPALSYSARAGLYDAWEEVSTMTRFPRLDRTARIRALSKAPPTPRRLAAGLTMTQYTSHVPTVMGDGP